MAYSAGKYGGCNTTCMAYTVHLDVHSVSWRIGHALTARRRQQGARHRQRIRRNIHFGVRPWIKRQHFYGVYETLICWARERERVKWRFIVRSVCDYFCPRSLVVIIARLSHGERMVDVRSFAITCHFSATKLIAARFLNMFKNLILNARSIAVTLVIAQMPYVWRTFTCVHWR